MLQRKSVLKLDVAGIPQEWISPSDVAEYFCKDKVSWTLGSIVEEIHGGTNRLGDRTVIEVPSIIAVKGASNVYLPDIPSSPTREKIFFRDRNMCAYCGNIFHPKILQAEHIHPKSRGGLWSWTNITTACCDCNQRKKKDQTPEEAGMPLLYLPYVPSHWENMIMEGRHILADQMDFLMASLPKHSRLLK